MLKTMMTLGAVLICVTSLAATAAEKTLIDYFLPMPVRGGLTTNLWGAPGVWPRDPQNGLEDTNNKWCYWDGQILKGPEGKFHLFASRWAESKGHNGWWGSHAVQAVSDNILGPYADQGLCWPDNQNGKGHNVTALKLPDGRYAVVTSETRPGDVFALRNGDLHLGGDAGRDEEPECGGPARGRIRVDIERAAAARAGVMVEGDALRPLASQREASYLGQQL